MPHFYVLFNENLIFKVLYFHFNQNESRLVFRYLFYEISSTNNPA